MKKYEITSNYNSQGRQLNFSISNVESKFEASGIISTLEKMLDLSEEESSSKRINKIGFYDDLLQIEVGNRRLDVHSVPVYGTLKYLYEHRQQEYCSHEELINSL